MKKIVVFSALAIFIMSAMGQKIENPSVRKSEVPNCKITSVYIDSDKTTIDFNYKSKTSKSSICVGDNLFIRDNLTGQKYFLIKAINIPICPENVITSYSIHYTKLYEQIELLEVFDL